MDANALDEATARGDEFNALQFRANLDKPQQADKDSAEEYLFGQQPAVVPSILKPLVSTHTESSTILGMSGAQLEAMQGGKLSEKDQFPGRNVSNEEIEARKSRSRSAKKKKRKP